MTPSNRRLRIGANSPAFFAEDEFYNKKALRLFFYAISWKKWKIVKGGYYFYEQKIIHI